MAKGIIQLVKKANKSINKINQFVNNNEPKINKNVIKNESTTSFSNSIYLKLNPLKDSDADKVMITNGFLNQISYFHDEDEVLFFPFSAFELVDIYDKEDYTFVVLDYSPRFVGKIENCIFSDNNNFIQI